jgi:hypothetical protein
MRRHELILTYTLFYVKIRRLVLNFTAVPTSYPQTDNKLTTNVSFKNSKTMKKILMTLMVAFLATGVAMAQGPGRGGQMNAEQMTQRMVEQYKLNDTQKADLLKANKAYLEKMQSMFSQQTPGERPRMTDAQREEMRKSREAYTTKLKEILTKEQYAAYEKDQRERFGGGGGPRGPRARRH